MKPLRKIVSYRKGKPPKMSAAGTVPVLTPGYLRTGKIEEQAEPTSHDVVLEGDEIILLWDGSNAGEFFRARPGILSSTMVVFEFDEQETNCDYLFYELKRFEPQLKGQTAGSGIPHVDKEILLGRKLVERDPKQQQKVVEVLATVDSAIVQTEALVEKQKRVKAGLTNDLLTRGLDTNGRLRDSNTHNFKSSPIGPIPVDWVAEKLETRTTVRGGKRLPEGHKYSENETGFRYLQTTDFINKRPECKSLHSLSPETFQILESYEISDGDIFLSIAGVNLGVAGVFRPELSDRTILTENAANIEVFTSDIPEFIVTQINGPFVQEQITTEKGIGSGVPKLALFRIQNLTLAWPIPDEQAELLKVFSAIEKSLQSEIALLEKLQHLKIGLMEDLLTGHVPVTPLLATQTN